MWTFYTCTTTYQNTLDEMYHVGGTFIVLYSAFFDCPDPSLLPSSNRAFLLDFWHGQRSQSDMFS
jgi:hypothetical protein